ncbi:MAG: hypothetical protein HXY41_09670 [Chloroflexi bacterium]|nr:hypothetical protein [Chloroflexota bacterium]
MPVVMDLLMPMREYTTSLNGAFYMHSAPGKATCIRVRIPNSAGLEAEANESRAD